MFIFTKVISEVFVPIAALRQLLFRACKLLAVVLAFPLVRVSICLVLAVGMATMAFSQTTKGRIVGTVTDSTGAVIPGVTVMARDLKTNAQRSTVTNEVGGYVISDLTIGTMDGFIFTMRVVKAYTTIFWVQSP